jgi:hypothetical protein
MFVDQSQSSSVRLSRAKSDPAMIPDRLDECFCDPNIILGDEDSFSAQHGCHLVKD